MSKLYTNLSGKQPGHQWLRNVKIFVPGAMEANSLCSIQSATLSNGSGCQTVTFPKRNAAGNTVSSPRSSDPVLSVPLTQAYLTLHHEGLGFFIRTKGPPFLHACSYTSFLLNPCLLYFPRSRKPFFALICRCDQRLTYTSKCGFKIIRFWDKMESRLIYPLRVIKFCSLLVYLALSLQFYVSSPLQLLKRFRCKGIPPKNANRVTVQPKAIVFF